MTQEEEENILLLKIKNLIRENELLCVIAEELDDLLKNKFEGYFLSEETQGLLYSLEEYKKWKYKKGE